MDVTTGESVDVDSLITDAEEDRGVLIADALLNVEDVSTWVVEEDDFIWALVTWQEARQSLNSARLARRYPTIADGKKADLQKAMARVKCWNCGARGHISKDSPQPRRSDRKPKGGGKGGVFQHQLKK